MYRILFGTQPDALVHEMGYTTEARARDVYRDLSFNRYAVLMCGDDVIDGNLKTGPTVDPEETK
jgi:hypothetical protein